jgi:hypothetical protein
MRDIQGLGTDRQMVRERRVGRDCRVQQNSWSGCSATRPLLLVSSCDKTQFSEGEDIPARVGGRSD